jgi:hypothetical protein
MKDVFNVLRFLLIWTVLCILYFLVYDIVTGKIIFTFH